MIFRILLTIVLFFNTNFAAVATENCVAENAIYTIYGEENFRIRFTKLPQPSVYSDIALVVEDRENDVQYPFRMIATNGYSLNYLIFDEELTKKLPAGVESFIKNLKEMNLHVFFFSDVQTDSKEGSRIDVSDIPGSTNKAPDKLFLPELGVNIWYSVEKFDERVSIVTEIWHLTGCSK